jgi:hypothetical protein
MILPAVRFSTLLTIILALLTVFVAPAQTPKSNPKPASTATPYPATTDHAPPAWFIDVASQAISAGSLRSRASSR